MQYCISIIPQYLNKNQAGAKTNGKSVDRATLDARLVEPYTAYGRSRSRY